MGTEKISFEESLGKQVLECGKCAGCGACIVVCPFKCLEYVEGHPGLVKDCQNCGICPQVCPQYLTSTSEEESVFGRKRKSEEKFGMYERLAVGQAVDTRILEACQDGGVVTALLKHGLERDILDSAIVSGLDPQRPFHPVPRLVTTIDEVLECAGTRYSYSPNVLALSDAIREKKNSVAFVGTPCQIRALRRIQRAGLKRYTRPIKILIGLMCSESFTYDGLMRGLIHEKRGVDLSEIKKMNIKGKILVRTKSGVEEISLKEAKTYARGSCSFCSDFSSELADISAGGLGLDGWTFTIIRTEQGDELFSKAEETGSVMTRSTDEERNALNLLVKLSDKKRQNTKNIL